MKSVGLKVLKNRLSEYVRLAAGGETVLVTDRDRVVAEFGPPREGRSPVLDDALLAEAVRHGWIHR
jgi:antitoxin (DNA-binding transcriptional repressor) of toxin-antitoxin stability system